MQQETTEQGRPCYCDRWENGRMLMRSEGMRVYHSRAQLKCEVDKTASASVSRKEVTDVGEPLRRGRSDPRACTMMMQFVPGAILRV